MSEVIATGRKTIVLVGVAVIVVAAVVGVLLALRHRDGGAGGGGVEENAWFTFSPSAPTAGAPVHFTDASSGSPTAWLWDFGDGTTSTAQNPSHTYENAGTYTVRLTVTYSGGKQKSVERTVTVSQELPEGVFVVYSDDGIVPGIMADVWVWSGADYGLEGPALLNGDYIVDDAPEGTKVFACVSGSGSGNYVGWGVFLGVNPQTHQWEVADTVDLSRFSKLEFWVKSDADLKVEIEQVPSASPENNPRASGKKSSAVRISSYGWDRTKPNDWQKVSIPLTAFKNVDLTRIRCPFMATGEGANKTFYIDYVVWVP